MHVRAKVEKMKSGGLQVCASVKKMESEHLHVHAKSKKIKSGRLHVHAKGKKNKNRGLHVRANAEIISFYSFKICFLLPLSGTCAYCFPASHWLQICGSKGRHSISIFCTFVSILNEPF